MIARDRWRGTRSGLVYSASAQSAIRGLRSQVFPGFSGDEAPKMRRGRALFNPGGHKGKALVQLYYETIRRTGRAVIRTAKLSTRSSGFAQAMVVDLDGKTITGPDQHSRDGGADGKHSWQVIQGAKLAQNIPAPFAEVVVETAYPISEYKLAIAEGRKGMINDAVLPNFGNAPAETMLLRAVGTQYEYGESLVNVDYAFWWSTRGVSWNQLVQSQKGVWIVRTRPEYTYDAATNTYAVTGRSPAVLTFQPAMEEYAVGTTTKLRAAASESRRCFPTTSFEDLDSMVKWMEYA